MKVHLALLGDVWYQIMDTRNGDEGIEYLLFTRNYWIPENWIKEIRVEVK